MSKPLSRAAVFATLVLAGCASNSDIPTYSGEVRSAVTEAGAFVRNELSSPMPAWDNSTKPIASAPATITERGTTTRNSPAQTVPAALATPTSVELYSVDSAASADRPATR
jgi:hypothetical protein